MFSHLQTPLSKSFLFILGTSAFMQGDQGQRGPPGEAGPRGDRVSIDEPSSLNYLLIVCVCMTYAMHSLKMPCFLVSFPTYRVLKVPEEFLDPLGPKETR